MVKEKNQLIQDFAKKGATNLLLILLASLVIIILASFATGLIGFQGIQKEKPPIQTSEPKTSFESQPAPPSPPSPSSSPPPTNLSKAEKCYEELGKGSGIGSGYMPNPASHFCGCMGGSLSMEKTPQGERELCKIGSTTYEEWKYFHEMNPYDNTYSPCSLGYDAWVDFCKKNRNSVYCKNYHP